MIKPHTSQGGASPIRCALEMSRTVVAATIAAAAVNAADRSRCTADSGARAAASVACGARMCPLAGGTGSRWRQSPLPDRAVIAGRGLLSPSFAPDSTGATDYYSLCEEVIERVEARTT